jgi:hypothetical protein
MMRGTVTSTDAAMIGPQGISCCEAPDRSAMATGTVRWVSSHREGEREQEPRSTPPMKASRPGGDESRPQSGRNTLVITIQGVAPSTIAASSISTGRSRMKVVSTQTVKGRVKIV